MPEKMPKPPFRDRERGERTPLAEEIKAVLGIYEFTRRLRAKNPDDPKDVDKSPEDTSESVGDHIAMSGYLMHYFLPLLERSGMKINYERTFDMLLAHDIGHIANLPPVPAIQKTQDQKRDEILQTAKIFGELPRRDGFNQTLFNSYGEYLGQATLESRFVNAISGLETMLYILSRPPHMRPTLVAGKGYAIEDYRERIAPFCREFPPMQEFYTRIERLFHTNGYFAPSRVYENNVTRPETLQRMFMQNAPDFGDPKKLDVDDENERLLRLQHLKREVRFGQPTKPVEEYHDTVAEHIASLLFLNRYFLEPTKKGLKKLNALIKDPRLRKDLTGLDLRRGNETILAHDAGETLAGEKITLRKTEADARAEWDAATEIASEYAPRAGKFNEKFWRRLEPYDLEREGRLPFLGNSWFLKGLDMFEAQLYIFDRETRNKIPRMTVMSREAVMKKVGPILKIFPVLREHFKSLNRKFLQEGLP